MYDMANQSNLDFDRTSTDQEYVYLMQLEWESVARVLECDFDKRKGIMYSVA